MGLWTPASADPTHQILPTLPAWTQDRTGPARPSVGAAASRLAGLPAAPAGPCQRATWPFPGRAGRGSLSPLCWSPPYHGWVRAGPSFRGLPLLLTSRITRQDLNSGFPRISQLRKAVVEEMLVWGSFPSHNSQGRCGSHSHPQPCPVQTFPKSVP